jgi:4-aminobutyrate aminotransferase-like enzyme
LSIAAAKHGKRCSGAMIVSPAVVRAAARLAGVAASSTVAPSRGLAIRVRNSAESVQILSDHFSPAVPRAPKGNNIVAERAKGSWIYSADGRKFLDLQTGIGVANTGHAHDK